MFPSSEVTPHLLAPGIRPSIRFGSRTSGAVAKRERGAKKPKPDEARA
jgi:hypothetical protein